MGAHLARVIVATPLYGHPFFSFHKLCVIEMVTPLSNPKVF
jgi:hypothetical protein